MRRSSSTILRTIREIRDNSLARERLNLSVLGVFALVSLKLYPRRLARKQKRMPEAPGLPQPAVRPGGAPATPEIDNGMGNLGHKCTCGEHPGE